MEVYLDNAATTKVSESVQQVMIKAMNVDYGNPSSMHKKGFESEQQIKKAKKELCSLLKCKDKNIIFTSGGTESNNISILGTALANKRKGKHIITSSVEHPSVTQPLIFLEKQGFEITYLPVDTMGKVSTENLKKALRNDTILVSIMYVNNEIGSVNEIASLSKVVKNFDEKIVFHVDAIQAFGKYNIIPKKSGIDLMSVSAHKFHGPKGIGLLYIEDGVKISPILFGGGQQNNMRSGTENVPGMIGLSKAACECYQNLDEKIDRIYDLKKFFIKELKKVEQAVVNAFHYDDLYQSAPHIVSVGFTGVKSEVLLHALEDKGIYISSGSACATKHPGISSTLLAIGVKEELLDSTIRFSFSVDTTKEEIEYTIEQLAMLVPFFARFQKR